MVTFTPIIYLTTNYKVIKVDLSEINKIIDFVINPQF